MKAFFLVVPLAVALVGCVPSSDSSGAGGAAAYTCPNGGCALAAGCTEDKECATGHCADGICCDVACDGSCVACVALKTGGANGTCAPILADTDPDGECGLSDPATCGAIGKGCNGNEEKPSCYLHPAGTSCAGSACMDGKLSSGSTCDGSGTCVVGSATADCAPYTCSADGKQCATSCASDLDCVDGFACSQGTHTCVPNGNNGKPCGTNADCSSGHCVDGICCNFSCDGACDACVKSKGASVDGACSVLPTGSLGDPSCGAYVCDGKAAACPASCLDDVACSKGNYCDAGVCVAKKLDGAVCQGAGECASGHCADGVCCNTACGAACDVCSKALGATNDGTCTLAPKGFAGDPSCAPFACNGKVTTCPLNCTSDGECASNAFCAGIVCQKKSPNGAACTTTKECASGLCVDGVCCNDACGGKCKACNVKGAEGTCSFVPNETDPGAECLGHCDGAGACAEPTFAADFVEIAAEKCGPCHTMGNAGGTNFAAVYGDSQLASKVCAGMNVAQCALVRIKNGSMPKGKGCTGDPMLDAGNMACLTAFEQSVVETWVNSGQPQ